MSHQIVISQVAKQQLAALSPHKQRFVRFAIATRLTNQLDRTSALSRETRRLLPNASAEYELRHGDLRILYSVEDEVIRIAIIGRKRGSTLLVDGKEYRGNQEDPAEPT